MYKYMLLVLAFLLASESTSAASIIYYHETKKGEREFRVIPKYVIQYLQYEEEVKLLEVTFLHGADILVEDFKVDSVEAAETLIMRIYDPNDYSLIKLEQD